MTTAPFKHLSRSFHRCNPSSRGSPGAAPAARPLATRWPTPRPCDPRPRDHGFVMGARAANALIGFWMFLSTFLWPHAPAQRLTGWIVGTAAVTGAMAGLMSKTWGRYLNAALGGWLL